MPGDAAAPAQADQRDAGDDDGASTDPEPSWISSWTGPNPAAGDTGASDQDASAGTLDETTQPVSDAAQPAASDIETGQPEGAPLNTTGGNATPAEDATAATDDDAVASEQTSTEAANPDARPEWMRNLIANREEAVTAPDQIGGSGDDLSSPTESEDGTAADTTQNAPSVASDASPSGALGWSSDDQTGAATAGAEADTNAERISAGQTPDVAATTTADSSDRRAIDAPQSSDEGAAAAPVAASTAVSDGSAADTLGEAEGLLDRLRALLPTLAAPAPAAPGMPTSGIADQLQEALNQNAKPEFDDLRGVLEAAKERPRDVDTMLTLVGKIDPMLALLRAHGNLLTAISTAVTQLRDENSGQ